MPVLLVKKRKHAFVDAFARRRIGWTIGIVEGSMRRTARASRIGVETLEDEHLVATHVGKVTPTLIRTVPEHSEFEFDRRPVWGVDQLIAADCVFGPDRVHLAERQRRVLWRVGERTPDIVQSEAPAKPLARLIQR
jgi:hypothetical protein